MGHVCTWQRSLSLETNIRPTKKSVPGLRRLLSPGIELVILGPQSPISCPEDRRLLVTIVDKHWPLTICSWIVQFYSTAGSLKTLFETIPETCVMNFCEKPGYFYLIWTVKYSMEFLIWISSQLMQFWTWTSSSTWAIQSEVLVCS